MALFPDISQTVTSGSWKVSDPQPAAWPSLRRMKEEKHQELQTETNWLITTSEAASQQTFLFWLTEGQGSTVRYLADLLMDLNFFVSLLFFQVKGHWCHIFSALRGSAAECFVFCDQTSGWFLLQLGGGQENHCGKWIMWRSACCWPEAQSRRTETHKHTHKYTQRH